MKEVRMSPAVRSLTQLRAMRVIECSDIDGSGSTFARLVSRSRDPITQIKARPGF